MDSPTAEGGSPLEYPDPLDASVPLRVAVGFVAVLLLFGAAAITSVSLSRPPPSPSAEPTARAEPITGMAALRPDVLMKRAGWSPSLPVLSDGGGTDEHSLAGKLSDEYPDELPFGERPARELLSGPLSDANGLFRANPSAGSAKSAIGLVRDFYRLLDRAPTEAATLISPELLGSQSTEFVSSWSALESVRARQVLASDGGSVVATVIAEDDEGVRMVLRHAFTVHTGTHPHITGSELISAELSHS